jgi:hypothetical protein
VEGGTDSGEGCNLIGKCLVSQLPKELPAGTAVEVTFQYQADGRLEVHATVPSVGREATMTIQRTSGFTEEQVMQWKAQIDAGLTLPESAFAPPEPAAAAGDDEEGFTLVDDETPPAPIIDLQIAAQPREVRPAPAEDKSAKAKPGKAAPAKSGPAKTNSAKPDSDELSFTELFEEESASPKVESDDSDLNDFLKNLR